MVLLAVLPILGTCCASVLKADVLLQIRRPEDLALLELSGSSGEGQWVVVRAIAAGFVASAAVVGDSWAWRGVVGIWRLLA